MNYLQSAKTFVSEISRRKFFTYASSGCYYLFMSLVPLAMLFCSILQFTPFSEQLVLSYVNQYFEESLAEIIQRVIVPIYSTGAFALTISILLTIYSASGAIKALIAGIDAAYGVERKGNFIVRTIEAIVDLLLLIVAVLVTLTVLVYGPKIVLTIQKYIPDFTIFNSLLSGFRFLLGILLLAFFFTIFYTILAAQKVHIRYHIPGALFTAIVWVIFSSVFSFYVSVSDKYGAYGIIGTVMVAMMWIYYCLLMMMIGALINSMVYEKVQKDRQQK